MSYRICRSFPAILIFAMKENKKSTQFINSIGVKEPLHFTQPFSNLTYAQVAKIIRNRLRRYSLSSIINIGFNHLTKKHENKQRALLSMPWLAALVIKIAIEDKMIHLDIGENCSAEDFEYCCNAIWNSKQMLDESVYVVMLGVRANMHAQFIFQRSDSFGFLRWGALISRLGNEHESRKLFETVFDMSPDEFMTASTLLLSQLKNLDPQTPLDLNNYSNLPNGLVKPLILLIDIFAKDLRGLRSELRKEFESRQELGLPARPESERYEFPWLVKYPLLKISGSKFLVWNSTILFHGLEEAIHIRLSKFGQKYTDSFSQIFEDYVVELIRESGVNPITDKEFKCLGNASMNAVDALIQNTDGNVYIESKMSLFADDVLLSDRPPLVKSKLRHIRKAIVQGWKVGDLVRGDAIKLKEASQATMDYLIVVTSRQLLFGNGMHLKQMVDENFFDNVLPESQFGLPTKKHLSRMPPQNITILSIEEFEHLVGAVKSGSVTYLSFAKRAAERATDRSTATMVAGQQIKEYFERWYDSELIVSTRERIIELVAQEVRA